MDKHLAIDLLQSLDVNFCKQIKELRLNTIDYEDQALEHGIDATDVLAKFENLKSLYFDPSFANFNADHLFSVCRNLKKIIRFRPRSIEADSESETETDSDSGSDSDTDSD